MSALDAVRRVGPLLVGAAALGWFAAPLPEPQQMPVQARRDDWRAVELPGLANLTTAAVEVATSPIWGINPKTAEKSIPAAAPVDKRWRIAGLSGRRDDRRVIVAFNAPDKRPLYLRVGELMPSGHKIVSIDDKELCVQIGNKAYRLAVERLE